MREYRGNEAIKALAAHTYPVAVLCSFMTRRSVKQGYDGDSRNNASLLRSLPHLVSCSWYSKMTSKACLKALPADSHSSYSVSRFVHLMILSILTQ